MKQYGFNKGTDFDQFCPLANTVFAAIATGTNSFYVSASECVRLPTPTTLTPASMCVSNGVEDAFEQCDPLYDTTNTCCTSKCKWAQDNANCATGNSECCVNCQATTPKHCKLPSDSATTKSGMF
jgi:hypothetical protein